jgi:hypothetical protein
MSHRHLLAISIAAVALAGAASGGAPAAGLAPRATGAPPRDVSYLFHAFYKLTYTITWREESGSESAECSEWRVDRGKSVVVAQDAFWKRRRPRERKAKRHGMPGQLVIFGRPRPSLLDGGWAAGAAVGSAKVTVQRSWIQRGGANWTPECGGERPKPFKASPADCGLRKYTTKLAAFAPQSRLRMKTLDDFMTIATPREIRRAGEAYFVLAFTIPEPGPLYQTCKASDLAPEVPTNVAIKVESTSALREIADQPGGSAPLEWGYEGPCDDASNTDAFECHFAVDLDMRIVTADPREPYP